MSRPLRFDFPGALHYLTVRGSRRGPIFVDDEDRRAFLLLLAEVVTAQRWQCHAFCLLDHHYHLVVSTPQANLAAGMRRLNGVHTQRFNRRHGLSGHLLQPRFGAILVEPSACLAQVCRHTVLNPVRVGLAPSAADWKWSSYPMTLQPEECPRWLRVTRLLAQLDARPEAARERYPQFVAEGLARPDLRADITHGIFLGGERFVARALGRLAPDASGVAARLRPAPSLADIAHRHPGVREAVVAAYRTGRYSYREIAAHFGIHPGTAGRLVRAARQAVQATGATLRPATSEGRPGGTDPRQRLTP